MKHQKVFRKLAAVLTAIAVTFTTLAGGGSAMTAAAAALETGTHVFQDPGIDVFGDGRQATYTVKFAEGRNAYCIQYAVGIKDLASYVKGGGTYANLTQQQKNQIAYVMAYGYDAKQLSLPTAKDIAEYVMTQTLIWCVTEGYWDNDTVCLKARDRMASATNHVYNSGIGYAQLYFDALRQACRLAIAGTVPSFTSSLNSKAPVIQLEWNRENARYEATLEDTNGVLSSFRFSGLGYGVQSVTDGNRVTFYTKSAISGTTPRVTISPAEGSYAARHCSTSVAYWGNENKDQAIVSIAEFTPDPIRAYVRFETETAGLKIHKVSSSNGEGLNNVTFDIYKDAACTDRLTSVVTQTADGAAGYATVTGLNAGMTYYIKERAGAAATNHRLLEEAVAVTAGSGETEIEIKNDRVPVKITLSKKDEKTGKGVEGAVYTLYAREDIKAAAGDAILYPAGTAVADFPATDSRGTAVLDNLYIGKYYIKEKTAPASGIYELDTKEYEVNAAASGKDFAADAVITVDAEVTEKRNPGRIMITKEASDTGEALEGAQFGIYKDADCTEPLETITTGAGGTAVSSKLPEGTYYIKEAKAPAGYAASAEVYEGVVTPAVTTAVKVKDEPITVKVSKTSVTGDCPEIPGAELVIKDESGNIIEEWVSTTEPHVIRAIPAGKYTLTEVRTPFGYQAAETVEFTVEDTGEIQYVQMTDAETYGKVIINKTDSKTEKPLSGVEFEIRIAEDVKDASGNTVKAAGTAAGTLITDENGYAESELLPIGTYGTDGWTSYIKYELVETKALENYIPDDTVYEIEFTYEGDKTPVITKAFSLKNTESDVHLEVGKQTISRTQPGDVYKYTITKIFNNSNVPMDEFTVTDMLPDEVTLTELQTGTYNEDLTYTVEYRLNDGDWITAAEGLKTTENNIIDLKNVQGQIRQFRISFGTVPAGFSLVKEPVYFVKVAEDTPVTEILDNDIELTGVWNGKGYKDTDHTKTLLFKGSIVKTDISIPETGDTANIIIWAVIAGLSTAAVIFLMALRKKQQVK